jgi:hypothetical protein
MHQHMCDDETCGGIHESGRRYHVIVRNRSRVGFLLGPYATHEESDRTEDTRVAKD